MHRVDNYQIANPVMKPDDRNWERGTWYTGVMEAWITTRDQSFFNQALNWGNQNKWQVGTEKLGANRLFCAETWTELYLVQHVPGMIRPLRRRSRQPIPTLPREPPAGISTATNPTSTLSMEPQFWPC